MIKKQLTGLFVFGMMVTMASGAVAITTDGDWSDWFSYSGDASNNNWREDQLNIVDPNIRTQEYFRLRIRPHPVDFHGKLMLLRINNYQVQSVPKTRRKFRTTCSSR